jgi:hypothetical protein
MPKRDLTDICESPLFDPVNRLLIDLDELSDERALTEEECLLYMASERYMFPDNECFRPENLAATQERYLSRRVRIGRKDEPKKVIADALQVLSEANAGEYPKARMALRRALQQAIPDFEKRKKKLIKANKQVTGQKLSSEAADELMAEIYEL